MDRGKRKAEMKSGSQNKSKKQKPNGKEDGLWFDLKEAKKEVRKFGIAGMTGTEKKSATINMLIGLGAKVTVFIVFICLTAFDISPEIFLRRKFNFS